MPSNTAVSLVSHTAVQQRLSSRITDLLDVPVTQADGLPGHICRKCKRKLERLEKAAEEHKRTKETSSSIGVSPDTLKPRLPAKRLTQRHLDFKKLMVIQYYVEPTLTIK